MEGSLLIAAFILGLSASPNCLAICMPVMIPLITSDRDSSPKLGLLFSIYLSVGRLVVYLALAAVTGYVGYTLLNLDSADEASGSDLVPKVIMGVIAVAVITYAFSLRKGWVPAMTCPKRLLPESTSSQERKVEKLPIIFGLLFASIICPPYLILLGTALVSSGSLAALAAGFLFWAGTLPVNLLAGTFSGEFGKRWRKANEDRSASFVTDVSALTLIMVGIWWLFLALG